MRRVPSHSEGGQHGHPVEYDFDAWAELSIRLIRSGSAFRRRVLEDTGAAEVWARANLAWGRALGDGVAAGDLDLLRRYTARLGAAEEEGDADRTSRLKPLADEEVTGMLELPLPARPATPFRAPPPPQSWTVERYAQLCAELQEWPARAGDIYQRAGIAPADRRRFHESWQTRLVADPALHARYEQLVDNIRLSGHTRRMS